MLAPLDQPRPHIAHHPTLELDDKRQITIAQASAQNPPRHHLPRMLDRPRIVKQKTTHLGAAVIQQQIVHITRTLATEWHDPREVTRMMCAPVVHQRDESWGYGWMSAQSFSYSIGLMLPR